MIRNIAAVAALAAGLGVAACGSSGSSPASPAVGTAPQISLVAQQVGCTNLQAVEPVTLYASEEVTCQHGGNTWDLATFADNTQRDNWLRVASVYAPVVVKGDHYAAVRG